MKRLFIALLAIFIFMCLSSCKRSVYAMEEDAKREAAYNNGYDDGYYDGYREASDHFSYIVDDEAVQHARKFSEWHPEEAMEVVRAYENGKPYGDTMVSEKEYKDAIESLYRYCEYLYHDMYD